VFKIVKIQLEYLQSSMIAIIKVEQMGILEHADPSKAHLLVSVVLAGVDAPLEKRR